MSNCIKSFVVVAIVAMTGSSYAAEMKIKPGQWEFRSTTSLPTPGGPREHVNQECIKDATMTPQKLMKDMNQGCELVDGHSDGSSMSWQVQCQSSGGQMSGSGQVESAGDSLSGNMKMSMSFNGQQMNMDVQWKGKRLGDC